MVTGRSVIGLTPLMLSACPWDRDPLSEGEADPLSAREMSPSSSAAFRTLSRSDWSTPDDEEEPLSSNRATLPPCLSGNGNGRSFSSGSATKVYSAFGSSAWTVFLTVTSSGPRYQLLIKENPALPAKPRASESTKEKQMRRIL